MKIVCPNLLIHNIYKAIIVGFADIEILKPFLNILEDIRLAFFKATWRQRNNAVKDFKVLTFYQTFKNLSKNS